MITKYGFSIDNEVIKKDLDRLTNQVWKLIPMREQDEDWIKQLNIVKVEIAGLNELFINEQQFLILLTKIEGISALAYREAIRFEDYRRTVFETINLLQEIKKWIK